MSVEYSCRAAGPEETGKLAEAFAKLLVPGTVLALDGDLGAGKTTFSQSLARGLGVQGIVNSPTFTIIKEYEGTELPLYHMDVYRITAAEADELGLDDYFYGDGVTIVEWASRISEQLPAERLNIYIEHGGGDERRFRIEPLGEPYESMCRTMKENGWL